MRKISLYFTFSAALVAAAFVAPAAVAADTQEPQLIAVLKSNATQKEKADACRMLARVATKAAVPALAAMLGDEQLAHMARGALETIRDPSADAALRSALGQLQGRPLLGVIGSLGVRRDPQAIAPLTKFLTGADAEVAQATARALGNIGSAAAAQAISGALAGASPANQAAFCEGLFRCAEAQTAQGQAAAAQAIYDRVRGLANMPTPVRAAALRGAILTRGPAGVPLLIEAVGGADYTMTMVAARAALELPGPEVTAALAARLPSLSADKQVLVANTLGYRGDKAAGAALLALAAKGPDAVRQAAVENLTHLAYAPVLPLLADLSLAGEGDLATAARTCLGSFPSKEADAAIVGMLAHKDAKVRALAIEMIGLRSVAGSAASLIKAAQDPEEAVRLIAIKALRDQAGVAELPALLTILTKARVATESQAAEDALIALCARQSEPASGNIVVVRAEYGRIPEGPTADVTKKVATAVKEGARAVDASNSLFGDPAHGSAKKLRVEYTVNGVGITKTVSEGESLAFTATSTPPAIVDALCAAVAQSGGEARLALLRTLRVAGGVKALQTVKTASAGSDAQVKDTALRALCDWPTPDAAPLVAELLKKAPSKTIKILALRGYVRLVPLQEITAAQKLNALKDALALAERSEEKRLVLSALGNVPTVEALTLVTSHLGDTALKEEACLAAVAIAEKVAASHSAEATAAMKQVAKLTANKKLAGRANAIARQAKK